jgi:hypothetical protein
MATVTGGTSNPVARNLARRMVEQAVEHHNEETENFLEQDHEHDSDQDAEANQRDDFDEELLLLGDDPYDSDDPRSFGGEYFWNAGRPASLFRKGRDYCRYLLFHLFRMLGFIVLVVQNFFGLNHSRFQWAVDLLEQETAARDAVTLERSRRTREE